MAEPGHSQVQIPPEGEIIGQDADGRPVVPAHPVIPFICGDGVGPEIMPVMQRAVDAAVARAYGGERAVVWTEIFAGARSAARYGQEVLLPEETLDLIRRCRVAVKGPLTTPVGGGVRSLNVTLRQTLDLYVCLRPVRYFPGVVSPVTHPELIDAVIFRENAEDIYAGIEWPADSAAARRVIDFLRTQMGVTALRFPEHCGIGIKPMSRDGTARLMKAALDYAVAHDRRSVTIVHKGNIMKYTEGAFKQWGYATAAALYGAARGDDGSVGFKNPRTGRRIIVKDCIADAFLQNILLYPGDYDVIAAMNLNGDYISDALAAQVGGIGIAPGANIGDECAVFEATHGTAPQLVGTGRANPCSLILSAEMMLRYIGWEEAADTLRHGVEGALRAGRVTADLAAGNPQAEAVSTAEFGAEIAAHLS